MYVELIDEAEFQMLLDKYEFTDKQRNFIKSWLYKEINLIDSTLLEEVQ